MICTQLGIPVSKYEEFRQYDHSNGVDILTAASDYWLKGNVEEDGTPCWESVVAALRSEHVDEKGLARRIEKKYCQEKYINGI